MQRLNEKNVEKFCEDEFLDEEVTDMLVSLVKTCQDVKATVEWKAANKKSPVTFEKAILKLHIELKEC